MITDINATNKTKLQRELQLINKHMKLVSVKTMKVPPKFLLRYKVNDLIKYFNFVTVKWCFGKICQVKDKIVCIATRNGDIIERQSTGTYTKYTLKNMTRLSEIKYINVESVFKVLMSTTQIPKIFEYDEKCLLMYRDCFENSSHYTNNKYMRVWNINMKVYCKMNVTDIILMKLKKENLWQYFVVVKRRFYWPEIDESKTNKCVRPARAVVLKRLILFNQRTINLFKMLNDDDTFNGITMNNWYMQEHEFIYNVKNIHIKKLFVFNEFWANGRIFGGSFQVDHKEMVSHKIRNFCVYKKNINDILHCIESLPTNNMAQPKSKKFIYYTIYTDGVSPFKFNKKININVKQVNYLNIPVQHSNKLENLPAILAYKKNTTSQSINNYLCQQDLKKLEQLGDMNGVKYLLLGLTQDYKQQAEDTKYKVYQRSQETDYLDIFCCDKCWITIDTVFDENKDDTDCELKSCEEFTQILKKRMGTNYNQQNATEFEQSLKEFGRTYGFLIPEFDVRDNTKDWIFMFKNDIAHLIGQNLGKQVLTLLLKKLSESRNGSKRLFLKELRNKKYKWININATNADATNLGYNNGSMLMELFKYIPYVTEQMECFDELTKKIVYQFCDSVCICRAPVVTKKGYNYIFMGQTIKKGIVKIFSPKEEPNEPKYKRYAKWCITPGVLHRYTTHIFEMMQNMG